MVWDRVWEEIFREREWGKYPDENLIRFIAPKYYKSSDREKIKILEVGCGPGANLWYIAREKFSAYGIDGSPKAIDIAGKRLAAESLSADLIVGDVLTLPYSDNYFDCVIDIECISANSANDAAKILQEICRVIKPGGYFFSKSVSDKMYIGKEYKEVGHREYRDIKEGPLAGEGLIRLMAQQDIDELYGHYFKIESIDLHEYTRNNQTIFNSEWCIVCSKNIELS